MFLLIGPGVARFKVSRHLSRARSVPYPHLVAWWRPCKVHINSSGARFTACHERSIENIRSRRFGVPATRGRESEHYGICAQFPDWNGWDQFRLWRRMVSGWNPHHRRSCPRKSRHDLQALWQMFEFLCEEDLEATQ